MRRINHNFMIIEPDNRPIRHLSEQLNILAAVAPPHTAPVAAVDPVNTAVILAELKCDYELLFVQEKILNGSHYEVSHFKDVCDWSQWRKHIKLKFIIAATS